MTQAATDRRMILDCDPGHDDAIAILLALAQPEWTVDGISIVAGNTTLDNAVRAAGQVLTVAGHADVPVRGGMAQPLVRPLRTAPNVHGESGLDGPVLPEPAVAPVDEHSVDWMLRLLGDARDAGETVEVAATGPLTNVAAVLRRDPTLAHAIERLVIMGGSINEGNTTPAAEFNILVDPEAASIVFDADTEIVMVGLDVTHSAIFPGDRFEELRALGTPVGTMAADLLDFFLRFHREQYGLDGVPIHDACAVAALLRPEILQTRYLRVDVETASTFCDGRTVVDLWGVTGREPNVHVGTSIDVDAFTDLLMESLASYPA